MIGCFLSGKLWFCTRVCRKSMTEYTFMKPCIYSVLCWSHPSILWIPSVHRHSLDQRSFSCYAALSVWNSLPRKVRSSNTFTSFRSSLKSHLLKLSYWLCVCVCTCARAHMHACRSLFWLCFVLCFVMDLAMCSKLEK